MLILVQGGADKKITIAALLAALNSALVFNSTQANIDARFEGQTDNSLIFVDASADKVGFGTAGPIEKADVNGNINIQGFIRVNGTPQAVTGNGALTAITLTNEISKYSVNAGGTSTTTLPDGVEGQTKIVYLALATGQLQITPANLLGFTTITLTALGGSVSLLFTSGKWVVLGSKSATIA